MAGNKKVWENGVWKMGGLENGVKSLFLTLRISSLIGTGTIIRLLQALCALASTEIKQSDFRSCGAKSSDDYSFRAGVDIAAVFSHIAQQGHFVLISQPDCGGGRR